MLSLVCEAPDFQRMLCGVASMKEIGYKDRLWQNSTADSDGMYKTWEVSRTHDREQHNGWDQVKIRHSISLGDVRLEGFPTTRKGEGIENPDRFYNSERRELSRNSTTNREVKTDTQAVVRPQFQISIEQPIRRVTPAYNVTFLSQLSKTRNGRRASDGFLGFSGKTSAPVFSAVSEEYSTDDDSVKVNSITPNNSISRVSSLNRRRFSDGSFHSVPGYTSFKKVSIVLPRPRKSTNEGSDVCDVDDKGCESDVRGKDTESVDCSRNEDDDQWKKLVAQAQGFKGPKVNGVGKVRPGLQVEDVKGNISRSMEDVFSDISSEASFSSNSSYHSSSDSDSAVYSTLTAKPISGDLTPFKDDSHISLNAARPIRRFSSVQSLDSYPAGGNHPARRYSVATLNPARSFNNSNATAKLSGYSTQSALEHARQLLSRLQQEGKYKSKKERLDELSKALKWILEELNRIKTPDRDLVSLFISLRAKIVNLKSELKAEEFDATCIDRNEVDSTPRVQTLLLTEERLTHAHSRRFSWC